MNAYIPTRFDAARLPFAMFRAIRLKAQQWIGDSAPVPFAMRTSNPAKRILVIASDEPIGEIVTVMLRTEHYECDGVWEHKAILRVLKVIENYDLLFCQVSALENEEKLLKWVLGPARDIPLVASAIRPWEQVPKQILNRCTFLQGPFEKQQLVAVVQEAIRGGPQTHG